MVQTASLIYINQGAQERWPDTTPPVLPTREYSYGTLRGLRIWSPDDGHWSMLLDDFLARSLTKVVPDDPLRTNRCRLYYAISSNNGTFCRWRKNPLFDGSVSVNLTGRQHFLNTHSNRNGPRTRWILWTSIVSLFLRFSDLDDSWRYRWKILGKLIQCFIFYKRYVRYWKVTNIYRVCSLLRQSAIFYYTLQMTYKCINPWSNNTSNDNNIVWVRIKRISGLHDIVWHI